MKVFLRARNSFNVATLNVKDTENEERLRRLVEDKLKKKELRVFKQRCGDAGYDIHRADNIGKFKRQ